MALFKATIKNNMNSNGVHLPKGLSVNFSSTYGSPLSTNGGHEVVEAFMRQHGVDVKKANAINSSYILIEKVG
jgi:hypothetical protein